MKSFVGLLCLLGTTAGFLPAAEWREVGPVVRMGDPARPSILWNDPTVLKEGSAYHMWLSGGDTRNLDRITVEVYEGWSLDGRSWQIGKLPVVSPSVNPRDWDSLRIETPTVVKVGSVYHMYYSGFNEEGARTGRSQIGHATSVDGTNWVKDPRNPILSGQTTAPSRWMYGGIGEPGVVYNPRDRQFYLYYTGMRYSPGNPTIGHVGVLLAKSADGSQFTPVTESNGEPKLILFRDVPGAWDGAWFGYSTPSACITSDGQFQLMVSFLVAPQGPATARHVVIARAVSANGVNFKIAEENIYQAGMGDWKDHQVRAPALVESDGQLMMWMAGERYNPFGAVIGLAVRPRP